MCFICQDTKEIFVLSKGLSDPEPCPICNDFSLKELDRVIISHKYQAVNIKSIRMSEDFYRELSRLLYIDNKKVYLQIDESLLGIPITIDINVDKWEIEYEK